MLARLAHAIARHRKAIILAWLTLSVIGVFSASQVSQRWLQSFSIPGYPAYEANQRTLERFDTGERPPSVVVFQTAGDATRSDAIRAAMDRAAESSPGARVSSFFSTDSHAYVSEDRHTTFMELYPAGGTKLDTRSGAEAILRAAKRALPPGIAVHVTGHDSILEANANGQAGGPSVLVEALIGGVGALVILFFVFGTLPAVLLPIASAAASILNAFTLVWILTYLTDVSIVVQFLIALVGLGVGIDYALLMIFRFRDELREGEDVETALVETMTHAGKAVVVSGSTVAIGLLSMVILPLPFIRSIGIGGMLIPAVSVLAAITLVPALLGLLGPRINRLRVIPERIVTADPGETGFWHRWAGFVVRRPWPVLLAGLAVVVLLLIPAFKINPADAQAKDLPGKGDAFDGRKALQDAGITAGVMKPFVVLAEGGPTAAQLATVVSRVEATEGVAGAAAPEAWRKGGAALVEVFPSDDGSSREARKTIARLKDDVLPAVQSDLGGGAKLTLAGAAPEERDFVHAVYGNFPYVLAFVIILTFLLLMRAFRSVVLPLKAVILNLISLGCAFGVVVFVFQQGHGSDSIWSIQATDAVISWIPLMIFAFLFGLSMDYEVFIVSRIREAYDETHDTSKAISLGLARTGKLVTSAALVLVFAFFALSTGPGPDIKQFGIGLAAGVLIDATLIRSVLVPSIIRILGDANWWFPPALARIMFVRRPRVPEDAADAAPAID